MKATFVSRLLALVGLALFAVPTASAADGKALQKATFAGGCFWCMEAPFAKLDGVIGVTVGYAGGTLPNPTYEQVSEGTTGHAESVQVTYDPKRITYEKLLDAFWRSVDPTDAGGQFVDRGSQYRTAIFYQDESQKKIAEESKAKLGKSGRFKSPIVTEITRATAFYPAEDYHQHYYKKNPVRYHYYRFRSGRDQFLEKVWGTAQKS